VRLLAANGPVDAEAFAARARWMLHPELDLAPLYALAQSDPDAALLVTPLTGLRAFRLDSAFESLMITMIEQQIALTMAQAAERWLIHTYGESLTFEGETTYAFPRPEMLARLAVADLAPLKITFIRMRRLLTVAQAVTEGSLDLEGLVREPDALYHRMLALSGVGHWTAAWALIRACGQFRYFGRADVALRAAANQHFAGLPGRMDGDAMDARFARFGDSAGLAAFYLIMRYAHDKVKL
jgi:DNA-3-methyladenine glycosylase II